METCHSATSKSEDTNISVLQQKPQKHVTDRLKKEDEEEQWISGEELYTDESSDEEGKKGVCRKHRRDKVSRPKAKASLSSFESLPKPELAVPINPESDNEEPIDISWKPKRGSIKLPHMTKDMDISLSSTSKSSEAIAE